jgi:hypothetical protein
LYAPDLLADDAFARPRLGLPAAEGTLAVRQPLAVFR